jgi:hypothetical protein
MGSPVLKSAMQTAAVLFRGLSSLTCSKPLQLDPMSTMVSLATIPFRRKGTKLTFDYEQSTIDFLPPSAFQGTVRSMTGASKFQLAEIKDVALAFVATYNTAHPHIAFLLKQSIGGLQFLAESCYNAPEDRLVKHSLEYYQLLLSQAMVEYPPASHGTGTESKQQQQVRSSTTVIAATPDEVALYKAIAGGAGTSHWSTRDITMAVLTLQQIRDLIKNHKVSDDLGNLTHSQQEQIAKWLSVLELLVSGSHTEDVTETKRSSIKSPSSVATVAATATPSTSGETSNETEETAHDAAEAQSASEQDLDEDEFS